MVSESDRFADDSRRDVLNSRVLKNGTIREATLADWPAIESMRLQYAARVERPNPNRPLGVDGVKWVVVERDRIVAAAAYRDFPGTPTVRFVLDFVRDESRVTSMPGFVLLARWLVSAARAEGYEMLCNVDRRNPDFGELLMATGNWELEAFKYRMISPPVEPKGRPHE